MSGVGQENRTGLPDTLKAGIESLSGPSDVRELQRIIGDRAIQRAIVEQPRFQGINSVSHYPQQANLAAQPVVQRNGENDPIKALPKKDFEIPRLLHFYWVGREIDQGKVDNINKWAKQAINKGWTIWVWHDGAVSNAKYDEGLNGAVQLQRVTRNIIHKNLRDAYDRFVENKQYPAASDLARYSILLQFGGVYADVDVGPGAMDFSAPLKIQSELPIKFGPQLRDAEAVRYATGQLDTIKVTPELVTRAAAKRRQEGSFGNQFIISPTNSKLLEKLIFLIAAELEKVKEDLHEYEGFMITGQGAVAKHLKNPDLLQHIRLNYMNNEQIKPDEVIQRVFDLLVTDLPLEWITPESEDQTE